MKLVASLSGQTSVLMLIIGVSLVWFMRNAEAALLAKVIALTLPIIPFSFLLNSILARKESVSNILQPPLSRVIQYGIPLSAISLAGFGYLQADILMLAYYLDSTYVAYYAVCIFVISRLTMFSKAIGNGIAPTVANNLTTGKNVTDYFSAGLRYSLIISIPISLLLAINGKDIIGFVFGEQYGNIGVTILIFCAYFLLASILAVFAPILDFSGKAKVRAKAVVIGAVINILLNSTLIPMFGMPGAGIGTVAGYGIYFLVTMYTVKKTIKNSSILDRQAMVLILIVTPITAAILLIIEYKTEEMAMYINTFIIALFYPLLLLFFKVIQPQEINHMITLRRKNK